MDHSVECGVEHRDYLGKSWGNFGEVLGKYGANLSGIMEESAVDNYMEHVWDNNCGILSTIDSYL